MIRATVIKDSLSPQKHRITTLKLVLPRIILAELLTHRLFSRNSASSRAIPFKKMVKSVMENPFIPIAWQKTHSGMQGTEYFSDKETIEKLEKEWLSTRDAAVLHAKELDRLGVTKQLCNRILEPFAYHTVLLTATEFENFFTQRCPQYTTPVMGEGFYAKSWKELIANHSGPENIQKLETMKDDILAKSYQNKTEAEIHISALAEAIYDAMNESVPTQLEAGEWHIPFGDKIDNFLYGVENAEIKIATARCARISYETLGDNPKVDYEADIALHDRLLKDLHFSPFEHCARAMSDEEYDFYYKSDGPEPKDFHQGWCNNFRGFIQYRHLLPNQNN